MSRQISLYLLLATVLLIGVYCFAFISTSDNLIRAYVIGSEAKMHPRVAFITVLGAIQMIGLAGIFVGPMIAALFYALLKLLRDRIASDGASLATK